MALGPSQVNPHAGAGDLILRVRNIGGEYVALRWNRHQLEVQETPYVLTAAEVRSRLFVAINARSGLPVCDAEPHTYGLPRARPESDYKLALPIEDEENISLLKDGELLHLTTEGAVDDLSTKI